MASNIANALDLEYPQDIRRLRYEIPLLDDFSNLQIDTLYRRFSETYAATWLIVNSQYIKEFAKWLEE